MKPVSIIGMGVFFDDLTAKHLKIIKQADILVGGERHLDFFKNYPQIQKKIIGKIDETVKFIKNRMESEFIVVLASGDPLFFGIGSLLIKSLGHENVVIYPNISTIAAAFSRIKEPWQDIHILSMHGRDNEHLLLKALTTKDTIAVFTDPDKNPAWLANFLLENSITDFNISVFEQLGSSSERIDQYNLARAAEMKFADPNLAVLKRIPSQPEKTRDIYLGMPDNYYERQNEVVTKPEVRVVTLSKLRLSSDHIMWDLGAGSGSISIEASFFIKNGKIFAIEQKPERIEQIKNNKNRFNVNNLEIINATLPSGLDNLPLPDRIFIGGGGRELKIIIRDACKYLKKNGIMVINTVLIQNLEAALDTLKQIGLQTEVIQIQINRSKDMPWGQRLNAQNPVWIISGRKEF